MADIKIIVDSGSDIPQDIADKYNIGVISFLSIFGTEQYVQRTEITNEQFFDKLEEYDGIPTTSQTPFGDMLDYFKQQCEEHESVIYFALSSQAVSTKQQILLRVRLKKKIRMRIFTLSIRRSFLCTLHKPPFMRRKWLRTAKALTRL